MRRTISITISIIMYVLLFKFTDVTIFDFLLVSLSLFVSFKLGLWAEYVIFRVSVIEDEGDDDGFI